MTEQDGFAYRFGWGDQGVTAFAADVAVLVLVDVLRFTTAVTAAIEAGATVVPARWAGEDVAELVAAHGAVVAGRREAGEPSLSPTDLLALRAGTRLVLPSPNGATLSLLAARLGAPAVLAGCFRNATATARRARELAAGGPIGVVAAGELRLRLDGLLRFAVEDLLGAGAVLAALDPSSSTGPPQCSPEAHAARAAFVASRALLTDHLLASTSGRELVAMGFADDVHTSADLDVTDLAARLVDGEYRAV